MKKFACIFIIFILPVWALAAESTFQNLQPGEIKFPNLVKTNCHKWNVANPILSLDESFVNRVGSALAPTSCKGGNVCWSWKVADNVLDWQIFSSELPMKITNVERLTKTISQTIKKTTGIRKSAGNLVKAAQEFIDSSFGAGKEKGTFKERAMTESKSMEQSVEKNITPQFHTFLAKAIQGPFVAYYPFCISSAVDLFFKAYDTDRVNDLVEAFIFYKTVKPEYIDFSEKNTVLNRAKFLFSLYGLSIYDKPKLKDFAWAQSVLFAKLLDWEEFRPLASEVDRRIQKAQATYNTLKSKTTNEIASTDKDLAALKYSIDKDFGSDKNTEPLQDRYIVLAAFHPAYGEDISSEKAEFDKAVQSKDPLLDKKFIKPEFKLKPVVFLPVIIVIAAIALVVIRKSKKN